MVLVKRLNLVEGNTEVLRTEDEVAESTKKKTSLAALRRWKAELDSLFNQGPLEETIKQATWRLTLSSLCDRLKRLT